jgi:hypothetical protein
MGFFIPATAEVMARAITVTAIRSLRFMFSKSFQD